MARRKRKPSSSSTGALVFFGGIVPMLALVPLKAWLAIGFLVLVGIGFFVYRRHRPSSSAPEQTGPRNLDPLEFTATSNTVPSAASRSEFPRAASFVQPTEDELVEVIRPRRTLEARIPTAPQSYGPGLWISAGTPYVVGSLAIPGGMIYVGTSLKAGSGAVDPCLINPSLSIAKRGDYTTRDMGYWPSYSDISPTARRSYLEWLADGRKDPEADVGYVFLFFYGLERRAILDARSDAAVQEEFPVIAQELRRLLGIYGDRSHSFKRYGSELLNWITASSYPADLYNHPLPDLAKGLELPVYVRLALGRAAVDGAPVPAHLALGWAKLDPSTYLRTAAERCPWEFDQLFAQKYAQQYGAGLVLPRNRTKLRLVYQAASAGFRGMDIKLSFGDTPDVTALTAPIQKVRALVEETTIALDSYSRFVGKNPNARSALEGLLHLPATLWPQGAQDALSELKQRMGDGMLAMSFQELLSKLDAQSKLTKDKTLALARALESLNIGIEPDVLAGAKLPKPDEKVVLFAVPPGEAVSRATPTYQAAALTLQLASAVATADGDFSAREMSHLRQQVLSWTHLTPNHIRRLLAHLRLLMVAPASLPALKKKLEPLDAQAKEVLATFMATVAQSDGEIAPAEVKMLESTYKALGVDPKKVFSDVHAVAAKAPSPTASSGLAQPAPPSGLATASSQPAGFKLDAARIAELQRESQEVSALLANIFVDEEAAAQPASEPAILRAYVQEREIGPKSNWSSELRLETFETLAMVDLLTRDWFEPPRAGGAHFSTLVQQVLSVIAQQGGASATELYQLLCAPAAPFGGTSKKEFVELVRHLGERELLTQDSSGDLLHGHLGEKFVNHYSFYAAFSADEEFRIVAGTRTLGSMPINQMLTVGQRILFGGKTWKVENVDEEQKTVYVHRTGGGTPPLFAGSGGRTHTQVRKRMREFYETQDMPPYLDAQAKIFLAEGRAAYSRYSLADEFLLDQGRQVHLVTWLGDAANEALACILNRRGFEASSGGPGVEVQLGGRRSSDVLDVLGDTAMDEPPFLDMLLADAKNLQREKWDWALPPSLLRRTYASLNLDSDEALAWTQKVSRRQQPSSLCRSANLK